LKEVKSTGFIIKNVIYDKTQSDKKEVC
jgi:hypothetical protein